MSEDPRARTPEGESEIRVPETVTAELPGRMGVSAMEKLVAEGVNGMVPTVKIGAGLGGKDSTMGDVLAKPSGLTALSGGGTLFGGLNMSSAAAAGESCWSSSAGLLLGGANIFGWEGVAGESG